MNQPNTKNITLEVVQQNGEYFVLPPAIINQSDDAPVTLPKYPRELSQGYPWAPWGTNDRRPSEVRTKIGKVAIAGRVMQDIANRLFGNGLVYYRREDFRRAGTNAEPAYITAIEEFMEENRMETDWFFSQCLDHVYHVNNFSEGVMSKSGDFIPLIAHKESEFCRLELQNERTLNIDHLYYSPDFAIHYNVDRSRLAKLKLAPRYGSQRWLRDFKGTNFAWHSCIRTPGTIYYAQQFWLGLLRDGGWLDVSVSVPEAVNAMMENQITLKYQILIPETYFEIVHPEWNGFSSAERLSKIEALRSKIERTLKGSKNAFKSITTVFKQDMITGASAGKIEINAIDDKVKKDSWVPSADKSDAQVVQGLGGHPSLIGLAPEGGSMGAGSGSDKRELYNIEIDTNNIQQRNILELPNAIARFNSNKYKDWDIVWSVNHTRHTTTNVNKSGRLPASEYGQPKSDNDKQSE